MAVAAPAEICVRRNADYSEERFRSDVHFATRNPSRKPISKSTGMRTISDSESSQARKRTATMSVF